MTKRRIFISFDHDDTEQVNGFLGLRNIIDDFEFYNHKLDRQVNSGDSTYVMRIIREKYIRPASVTVVLIGNGTHASAWVKWEIDESLKMGKGILGIRLKNCIGVNPSNIPPDHIGDWQPEKFGGWIDWAYQQSQK